MVRAFILLLMCWVASSVALQAQQTQAVPIDLAASADLAVQRNLTIKASRQGITTTTTVTDQVKSLEKVRANLNASYYRLGSDITLKDEEINIDGRTITIPGQTVANQNVYFANVSAAYNLYSSGRIRYGIRSAEFSTAEATNLASDTEFTVVLQTTRTYLSAVYGRENVAVNQASLTSYERHLSETRSMRQQGVATDYDVIRAESSVEDQKKRLAEVCNQYELALANLRTALLLPKDAPIDLRGGFFNIPDLQAVSIAEENAVNADPYLRSIAERSNALYWAEKSIRAEKKPQVDAVGFVNLLNKENGFQTDPQWFVGFQLLLNILDGGLVSSRAAQRQSERVQSNIQLEGASNDVRLAVRSAYLDMSTACSSIVSAQKSVQLARESLRLAERRFAEGVGTSLEVLDANINLLVAETGLQQAMYQLDSAYLTAHRYLGDLVQVAHSVQAGGGINTEGRPQ